MRKLFCVVFALMFVLLPLCSCEKPQKAYTDEMFALDTIIRFTLYDEDEKLCKDTVDKCKEEITRLENLLSISKYTSDVYKLNNSGEEAVLLSEETASLISQACDISKSCDGAFDISVKPLMTLWGFDTKEYKVPSDSDIEKILPLVSYENIKVNGDIVSKQEDMSVDLGGIAKGYVADKVSEIISDSGVDSALVNLGGMIATVGTSSSSDKDYWRVGVEHPKENEAYFFTFDMNEACVSTTGAYQRYFEEDSVIYHHIIDPYTGKPVESDFSSVTVVGDKGVRCDALSTAFYVMGLEKTTQYINESFEDELKNYTVIILSNDMKTLYLSENFKNDNTGHKLEKAFDDVKIVYI